MRSALAHPFPVVMLGVSLANAAAMRSLPWLEPWSGRAHWMVALGLLAYAAAAVVVYLTRAAPQSDVEFVGRSQEMDRMQGALDEAMSGHARMVMLAGASRIFECLPA